MKTYTAVRPGVRGLAADAWRLYKLRTGSVNADVETTLVQKSALDTTCVELMGRPLSGQRVLVIGAGQTAREVMAFGVDNDVTAIDLDVIPTGFNVRSYVELYRQNGSVRTAKTIVRKLVGIDRRFTKVMCDRLGVSQPRPARNIQMDASKMSFADASFDVVYSFSVFEHLPDPEAVLCEATRVLRPGGVLSISWHIYTSEGGCHDLRILSGDRDGIPYWAQLRPEHKHLVVESCYMNEWRLGRVKELHAAVCPGVAFSMDRHHEPYGTLLANELAQLRAVGQLSDYTDEELLSVNLLALWAKPLV